MMPYVCWTIDAWWFGWQKVEITGGVWWWLALGPVGITFDAWRADG